MNAYLIVVMLALPGQDGPKMELQRQAIVASSAAVCQQHADQLAARQRESNADAVRRLGATVRGTCTFVGSLS